MGMELKMQFLGCISASPVHKTEPCQLASYQ